MTGKNVIGVLTSFQYHSTKIILETTTSYCKVLMWAIQLAIIRRTAFDSCCYSGPWWIVPVRKNIQVLLGKSPPCFQRMCLKLCFLWAQQKQQSAALSSGCPQSFLLGSRWDHTVLCCPLGSCTSWVLWFSASDVDRYHPSMWSSYSCPSLALLLFLDSSCYILTLWVLLRFICLHKRV